MDIEVDRKALLAALSRIGGVVPSKHYKPILTNVKFTATSIGATLQATDMECGCRLEFGGAHVATPGSALLPLKRLQEILNKTEDASIQITRDGENLVIRGERFRFSLPTEDPDLFPEVPEFTGSDFHVFSTSHLISAVKRTVFATDVESTRYALGGVRIEFGDTPGMIATDGRRLAYQSLECEKEGNGCSSAGVLPIKVLKLIERNPSESATHLNITGSSALIRIADLTMYTRLVEGRFPRYQDVFPPDAVAKIAVKVGDMLRTVEQAAILTSDESRGVDFLFTSGLLKLSTSAEVGAANITLPIDHDGSDIAIAIDPRYLTDALRTLAPETVITLELIDGKTAVEFRTDDGYRYVAMPLTRDR